MSARPESPMMRTLRQLDQDAHAMRGVDLLAFALGYGLMLAVVVAIAVTLVDWMQGQAHQVWPQIVAVLDWLDGARR